MFNFIHNTLSKLFFTKPSVHYIQPKSLNLRFKNGNENKFYWLNLQNYNSVNPYVEQLKEENNNSFLLKLNVQNKDGQSHILDVAKFETRKEAEVALNVIISKLYGPEKALVKISLLVLILAFIWGLAIDVFFVSNYNLAITQRGNNQALTQNVPNKSPTISAEEQTRILNDLQRQAAPQPQQPAPQQQPSIIVDPPNNPAVDSLLNSLGS